MIGWILLHGDIVSPGAFYPEYGVVLVPSRCRSRRPSTWKSCGRAGTRYPSPWASHFLAAMSLARSRAPLSGLVDRLFGGTLVLVATAHITPFSWESRRYSAGTDGVFGTLHTERSSPVGFLPGVIAYALSWRYSSGDMATWRAGECRIDDGTADYLAAASSVSR